MSEWRELGPQDLGLTRAERGLREETLGNKEGSAGRGQSVRVGWALADDDVRLSGQAIFLRLLGALPGRLRAGKGEGPLGQWDGGGMTQAAEQVEARRNTVGKVQMA